MIVVKATHVSFKTPEDEAITLPVTYGLLHDPEGDDRPKCEVFFGPYTKSRAKSQTKASERYFGDDYESHRARVDIPGGGWKEVARVKWIFYTRRGNRGVGGGKRQPFRHPFAFRPLTLERSGRYYRIVLGRFCIIDDRGFVFP